MLCLACLIVGGCHSLRFGLDWIIVIAVSL